jgi:hypothetical protein
MRKKRNAFLTIFLGHNRVGKTTVARRLALAYRKANPSNVIYRFDPQNKFSDIPGTVAIVDNDWEYMLNKKDCLIILDDYRMLLSDDKLDKNFLRLLALRDEHGIDIILITHHPDLIHQRISYYTTELFIFYCNKSDDTSSSTKLCNSGRVLGLIDDVNKYCHDRGSKYGDNPGDFIYLTYDNLEDTVKYSTFGYVDKKKAL